MADGERKRVVWAIKKTLLTLSVDELFQIAKSVGPVPGMDEFRFKLTDEEGCFEYICSFMSSESLLELEDSGMAHLLNLRDLIDIVIQGHTSQVAVAVDVSGSEDVSYANENVNPTDDTSNTHDTELQKILASYEELSKKIMQCKHTPTPQSVPQSSVKIGCTMQSSIIAGTRGLSEHATPLTQDKLLSLRELSYLHRRELKIQEGQIGDQGSDLSYNSVCRQMEDGLKEQFSDAEVVRAVLKVIKPGTFKDMLMNKDDLTVEELKAFLHSHLGEQSNTELFQELMCTKQKDNETPQQFLYRVIGL
ncbi:hypothetical protein Q7C36_007691 [Tachysurus vachellii]|uniref:Uncharacterized protein n=1 Tax=Tachysurus vachellii TaxID=175792 RepID=A0AA88NAN6_TACVA|nr:hypothetical protein Q7C36_007691 [Tachysurus vachellii]